MFTPIVVLNYYYYSYYYQALCLPAVRCVCRQGAGKICHTSYPLMDSPDPSKTQSTIGTVLRTYSVFIPCQLGPVPITLWNLPTQHSGAITTLDHRSAPGATHQQPPQSKVHTCTSPEMCRSCSMQNLQAIPFMMQINAQEILWAK